MFYPVILEFNEFMLYYAHPEHFSFSQCIYPKTQTFDI